MRLTTAVSAIAIELERINDYAKGIAKISLVFNPVWLTTEIALLREMAHRLQSMLTDAEDIKNASKMMWAAHNFERAGDRIGNICERIVFLVTGQIIELPYDDGFLHTAAPVSYAAPD